LEERGETAEERSSVDDGVSAFPPCDFSMGSPELCPCQSFHPDSIPEILYIFYSFLVEWYTT
jgi:hypothetical protein